MSLASDIRTALSANAALTAKVGTRIRPQMADENDASPYVVFEESGADPANGLDGHHHRTLARVQISAWAETFQAALEVSDEIRNAMQTANTNQTLKNTWEDRRDESFDLATRTYGIEQGFNVWQVT